MLQTLTVYGVEEKGGLKGKAVVFAMCVPSLSHVYSQCEAARSSNKA